MPTATQIIKELALHQIDAFTGTEELYIPTVADVKEYLEDMCEDFPENYDLDYYPLIVTPAINASIDWQEVGKAVQDLCREIYTETLEELKEKINLQELECLCAMR